MLKADFTQEEVSPPSNHWCPGLNGGHQAPLEWEREGAGKPLHPMKFFRVTGHGVNAVFCEACLIVARWMAAEQKKGRIP